MFFLEKTPITPEPLPAIYDEEPVLFSYFLAITTPTFLGKSQNQTSSHFFQVYYKVILQIDYAGQQSWWFIE